MTSNSRGWLVVLAGVEGLRWVLENSRMAWTEASTRRAARIRRGDRMVLYVARAAYHDPTRDMSQLIDLAEVVGRVRRLQKPAEIGGRTFVSSRALRIEVALPQRRGVPIKPLVDRLGFVKRTEVWGQYFRSGLIQVPARDFQKMAEAIGRAASRQEAQ